MVLSCHRCSQSNSGPSAFLLTCGSCERAWHHRCHIPPVEDTELIQRIRSTNAGDRDNGLTGWSCKRCKKKQVAETSIRTTALRPDNSRNVATAGGSAVPASSIDATTQVSHNVKGTEPNDHGSQHQQHQSSRTDSYMANLGAGELNLDFLGSDYLPLPDTDQLPTTVTKGLQVKRVLQEQSHDHGHDLGLYPDRPAASVKYARAPDGRKLVSPEHSSRPTHMNHVNSRSATLVSEKTARSLSASRSDHEGKHVHYGSVVQNPGEGSGSKKATTTDTPSGSPVEHGDIHMKNFGDDSDDLYETPVSHSTPGPSSSKQFREKQGGSVTPDGRQKFQQQEQSEETDDNAGGGVSLSHHEPKRQNSLAMQTPKADLAPLGPSWLKARYSVADDPCFCDPQLRMYGDRKRKKPEAKFLGDVVHSVATLDGGLLEFFFFPDWFHQAQVEMTT